MTTDAGETAERRRTPHLVVAVVVAAGVLTFSALSLLSWMVYDQTEDRLLGQRTQEAAAVLTVAIGQLRSPLESAAQVAAVTGGDPSAFEQALAARVGEGEGRSFSSAVLLRAGATEPISTLGPMAGLLSAPPQTREALFRAPAAPFVIIDLLDDRRLGYAVVDDPEAPQFVAYGERILSPDPTVRRRHDEPFAQLDYAMYLGSDQEPAGLITASASRLPLDGRTATEVVEFGDTELLLVMRPTDHLSSDLFASLWWAVLVAGAAVTAVATWAARRLVLGRSTALALVEENHRLYEEQRQIAETLQLSLLPQRLSLPPGVDVVARYWPAGTAALIGGDFYDAFDAGDGRWAVTIGDVCGKGIGSASLIGLARHTMRSAARHATSPAEVLRAVHQALGEHEPATFCTVAFAFLTPQPDGRIDVSLSLGGHPFPLLRRRDGSVESIGVAGSLLGMFDPELTDATAVLEPGDVLMLYTDGLTDAPADQAVPIDEILDVLGRRGDISLDELSGEVRSLKRRRRPRGSGDDTAVVLLRVGDATTGEPTEVAVLTGERVAG